MSTGISISIPMSAGGEVMLFGGVVWLLGGVVWLFGEVWLLGGVVWLFGEVMLFGVVELFADWLLIIGVILTHSLTITLQRKPVSQSSSLSQLVSITISGSTSCNSPCAHPPRTTAASAKPANTPTFFNQIDIVSTRSLSHTAYIAIQGHTGPLIVLRSQQQVNQLADFGQPLTGCSSRHHSPMERTANPQDRCSSRSSSSSGRQRTRRGADRTARRHRRRLGRPREVRPGRAARECSHDRRLRRLYII